MEKSKEYFAGLVPVETLYWYDGPRAFICNSREGDLLLAYLIDEDSAGTTYFIVPTTEQIVEGLKAGNYPVRSALNAKALWVVKALDRGDISDIEYLSFAEAERKYSDCIPEEDVCFR